MEGIIEAISVDVVVYSNSQGRNPRPPPPYSTVTVLSMDGLHCRSVTDLVFVRVYFVSCYSPRHLDRSWMRPSSFPGVQLHISFPSPTDPSLDFIQHLESLSFSIFFQLFFRNAGFHSTFVFFLFRIVFYLVFK